MSDTTWRKQILKITPIFLDIVKQYLDENIENNTKKHDYALDATNLSIKRNSSDSICIHTQYNIYNTQR